MKKQYSEPEFEFISVLTDNFLAASPDDDFNGNVDADIPTKPPSSIF